MANLASSAVEILQQYYVGDATGKRKGFRSQLKLTLTGQGGTSNKITAEVLGFSKIQRAYDAITDGNTLIPAAPSFDGTSLLLFNLKQNSDANRANPADITDTLIVTVEGY